MRHIIIIKTSSTGPSEKNKVVNKLLSQPHKNLRHGKLKKAQLGEAPTVDRTPEQIHRYGIEQSAGKVIPQSNLSQQERQSKLGRSTP